MTTAPQYIEQAEMYIGRALESESVSFAAYTMSLAQVKATLAVAAAITEQTAAIREQTVAFQHGSGNGVRVVRD